MVVDTFIPHSKNCKYSICLLLLLVLDLAACSAVPRSAHPRDTRHVNALVPRGDFLSDEI